MRYSLLDKIINALTQAAQHNSNIMVKPEVILWPDAERQWESIIPLLQQCLPALIVYGEYNIEKRQGPSIWLKCMVVRALPQATWEKTATPIIYLPGVSKSHLKNVQSARLLFQPIIEYQYTGTIFTQENGKEWTLSAFIQNAQVGMGLKVSQDGLTKDALKKALLHIAEENSIIYEQPVIDSSFLLKQAYPEIIPDILSWMCNGDSFMKNLDSARQPVFKALCKNVYGFETDYKNIKSIAEKLGSRRGEWKNIWQHYAHAPKKYPELKELLRLGRPNELFPGMYAVPEESWPQVNEEKEDELRKELIAITKLQTKDAYSKLQAILPKHESRIHWVWAELGEAPLARALPFLVDMATYAEIPIPSTSINELKEHYVEKGMRADQAMRKAFALVKSERDKKAISGVIQLLYKPWLEAITEKFQNLAQKDSALFTSQRSQQESSSFVLFVDAFRYELAEEFCQRLLNQQYKLTLQNQWSAIPSLTPTAKSSISPIADNIATDSICNDFRPQLKNGKDLQTGVFRETLSQNGFTYLASSANIEPGVKYWQEIGEIDSKGHEEQSNMVRRINELFEKVQEAIDIAFEKGVSQIKIVTDHGWLLLPGGLPKEELKKDLTETRWGRCALIKEGAKTDLLHLPWRWNPLIFIAYAPGISFFKKNEEYAHGGISIHECLVPQLVIENKTSVKLIIL